MKSIILFLTVLCTAFSFAQPRIQIIHNSPDDAATIVDIYLDDALLFDDLAFRTAAPFVDAPAGVEFNISVAPGTSTGVADAIASFPFTMAEDEKYLMVVNGITGLSATEYNPATPLSIDVFEDAREEATLPNNVSFIVHHGTTDAPILDMYDSAADFYYVNNISYSGFKGSAGDYYEFNWFSVLGQWEVLPDSGTLIEEYLLNATDYAGAAITILTSGFLDPSVNGDGPAFGVFFAFAEGGPLIASPVTPDNDVPCDAIELPTDGSVGLYTTIGSWVNGFELTLAPPQTGCETQDGWCAGESGISNTVWFSFIATSSVATISTCHDETTIDTQLAVFSVPDCSDFGTMTLVGANDDVVGGCTLGTSLYASEVNLSGLAIGEEYYVLVDGYDTAYGDFGISIDQPVGLSETRPVEFVMSPNPADETLWISSPEKLERIRIIDMQGRDVISKTGMFREIDISQLATGMYQVAVSTSDRLSYQKLMVE